MILNSIFTFSANPLGVMSQKSSQGKGKLLLRPFDDFVLDVSSCQTFNTLASKIYKDRHLFDVTFRSLLVFELLEPAPDPSVWADISEIKNGQIRKLLTLILEKPAERSRVLSIFSAEKFPLKKCTSGNGDVFFSWSEQEKEKDGRIRALILHIFFKSDAVLLPAPLFCVTHVKSNQTKASKKTAHAMNELVMQTTLDLSANLKESGLEHLAAESFAEEIVKMAIVPDSPFK